MNNNIVIINTGGTFNKKYNPLTGALDVLQDNRCLEDILSKVFLNNNNVVIKGILFKDSLEINDVDRKKLYEMIEDISSKKIIIVHGTDTIDKTATFLSQFQFEKQIILVGAMEPYLINPIEGVGNLMQAYGFLLGNDFNGIYISMHGIVSSFEKIKKNKELGVFECHL